MVNITMRPQCPTCKQRSCAINCYRDDRVYYRSQCDYCIRRGRGIKPAKPQWELAGYKKKPTCDRCGFRAKFAAQLLVYHVDGNLHNTALRNLKTVCQNCVVEIAKTDQTWLPGDLEPDV